MNNWEHRGEDMYCPRALLKLPRTGRDFFFLALRTALTPTMVGNGHFSNAINLPGWGTRIPWLSRFPQNSIRLAHRVVLSQSATSLCSRRLSRMRHTSWSCLDISSSSVMPGCNCVPTIRSSIYRSQMSRTPCNTHPITRCHTAGLFFGPSWHATWLQNTNWR